MADPFWFSGGSGEKPHELPDGIKDCEFFDFVEKLAVLGADEWLARGFICQDGSRLSPSGLTALNHSACAKVVSKMTSLRIAQLTSLTPQSLQPWGAMAEQLRVVEFPDGVALDSSYVRSLSRFPALEAIAFDGLNLQVTSVWQLIKDLRSIRRLRELALPRCMMEADEIQSLLDTCLLSTLVVSSQLVSEKEQKSFRESHNFCDIRWE